jgi:hypothetical protein
MELDSLTIITDTHEMLFNSLEQYKVTAAVNSFNGLVNQVSAYPLAMIQSM